MSSCIINSFHCRPSSPTSQFRRLHETKQKTQRHNQSSCITRRAKFKNLVVLSHRKKKLRHRPWLLIIRSFFPSDALLRWLWIPCTEFFKLCQIQLIKNSIIKKGKFGRTQKRYDNTSLSSHCSHSISRSPKFPLVFIQLDWNTVEVFYLTLFAYLEILAPADVFLFKSFQLFLYFLDLMFPLLKDHGIWKM